MEKRKNGEWDIIVTVPLDPGTEVVIGDRHTEFEPYVVWWCYNGNDYRQGDYYQKYEDAVKRLATRILPTSEAYHMGELANWQEECDSIIPYLEDDEGLGEAKQLYKCNYEFRRKVEEAYGEYWYRYVDDNTSDQRYDCVLDGLSKAYKEWKKDEVHR